MVVAVVAVVAVVPRTTEVVAGIVLRGGVVRLIIQFDYCEETVPAFRASVALRIERLHDQALYPQLALLNSYTE